MARHVDLTPAAEVRLAELFRAAGRVGRRAVTGPHGIVDLGDGDTVWTDSEGQERSVRDVAVNLDQVTEAGHTAALRLDQLDLDLAEMDTTLEAVGTTLAATNDALDALDADLTANNQTLTTVQDDLGVAQTDIVSARNRADAAWNESQQAKQGVIDAFDHADSAKNIATTADGRYTVATTNPTVADAAGKPIGAVWEVRSGGVSLRRFVLTNATTWTQVKAGQDFIGDKAIGSAQIGDLAVGTAQIAEAAVTDAKIADLTVGKLTAGTARMDAAAIDKLVGDAAWFNSLSTHRLAVGSASNMLAGVDGWNRPGINVDGPWRNFGHSNVDSSMWLKGYSVQLVEQELTFTAGVRYRFEVEVRASVDATRFYWQILGQDGASISWDATTATRGPNVSVSIYNPFGNLLVTGTGWNSYWVEITCTKSGIGRLRVHGNHPNGAPNPDGYQWFRNARIRAMTGSILIEDGAITADKIVANSITGDKITGNTITGDKIQGNTIHGDKIISRTIGTDRLAANAITSNEIASNTIIGDNIAGNTITGNKMLASSIGAREIAAKSITAEHMIIAPGNLFPDPYVAGPKNAEGWTVQGNVTFSASTYIQGTEIRITPSATAQVGTYYRSAQKDSIDLKAGLSYRVSVKMRFGGNSVLQSVSIYCRYTDTAGVAQIKRLGSLARGGANNFGTGGVTSTVITMPEDVFGTCSLGFFTEKITDGAAVELGEIVVTPAADASLIVDGAIQARHITTHDIAAELVQSGHFRTPPGTDGTYAVMDNTGFQVFRPAGEATEKLVHLGPHDENLLSVGPASMDESGGVTGEVGSFNKIYLGGEDISARISNGPRGIIGFAQRDIIGWSHEVAAAIRNIGIEVDLEPNRTYRISQTGIGLTGTTAGMFHYGRLGWFKGAWVNHAAVNWITHSEAYSNLGSWGFTLPAMEFPYVTGDTAETVTFISSVNLNKAPGGKWYLDAAATRKQFLIVEDIGPAVQHATLLYQDRPASTPPPVPQKKPFTYTYIATSAQCFYRGGGKVSGNLYQGSYNWSDNRETAYYFNDAKMRSDLSGAEIWGIYLWVGSSHWWYGAGGTGRFHLHGQNAGANTGGLTTFIADVADWPREAVRVAYVDPSYFNGFKNGTYKGWGFTSSSLDPKYYGSFYPDARIVIKGAK